MEARPANLDAPNPAEVLAASRVLLDAMAELDGIPRGLFPRGSLGPLEVPLEGTVLALTLEVQLQLASIAARAADLLREHPDPRVRRAAALLAGRGYPLLATAQERS